MANDSNKLWLELDIKVRKLVSELMEPSLHKFKQIELFQVKMQKMSSKISDNMRTLDSKLEMLRERAPNIDPLNKKLLEQTIKISAVETNSKTHCEVLKSEFETFTNQLGLLSGQINSLISQQNAFKKEVSSFSASILQMRSFVKQKTKNIKKKLNDPILAQTETNIRFQTQLKQLEISLNSLKNELTSIEIEGKTFQRHTNKTVDSLIAKFEHFEMINSNHLEEIVQIKNTNLNYETTLKGEIGSLKNEVFSKITEFGGEIEKIQEKNIGELLDIVMIEPKYQKKIIEFKRNSLIGDVFRAEDLLSGEIDELAERKGRKIKGRSVMVNGAEQEADLRNVREKITNKTFKRSFTKIHDGEAQEIEGIQRKLTSIFEENSEHQAEKLLQTEEKQTPFGFNERVSSTENNRDSHIEKNTVFAANKTFSFNNLIPHPPKLPAPQSPSASLSESSDSSRSQNSSSIDPTIYLTKSDITTLTDSIKLQLLTQSRELNSVIQSKLVNFSQDFESSLSSKLNQLTQDFNSYYSSINKRSEEQAKEISDLKLLNDSLYINLKESMISIKQSEDLLERTLYKNLDTIIEGQLKTWVVSIVEANSNQLFEKVKALDLIRNNETYKLIQSNSDMQEQLKQSTYEFTSFSSNKKREVADIKIEFKRIYLKIEALNKRLAASFVGMEKFNNVVKVLKEILGSLKIEEEEKREFDHKRKNIGSKNLPPFIQSPNNRPKELQNKIESLIEVLNENPDEELNRSLRSLTPDLPSISKYK